ncbi:MAG: hypothetical protein CM1200mP16_03670 [Nitrospina sp.]|nr:MAG: hypothetical protein CM1200mP16_03670 [Nitrospina sp.]
MGKNSQKKAVQSWVEWQVVYQIEVFWVLKFSNLVSGFSGEDAPILKGVWVKLICTKELLVPTISLNSPGNELGLCGNQRSV